MRLSKPCHAQQRGFFLLAVQSHYLLSLLDKAVDCVQECIHENPTEVRPQDTSIKEKKTELGKVLLNWTIRRFLEHDRSNELRKSVSIRLCYQFRRKLIDPLSWELSRSSY